MKKYIFDDKTKRLNESDCIPITFFQLIDGKIVTLLVSDGFCELLGMGRQEVVEFLNHIMPKFIDRENCSRYENSIAEFILEDKPLDTFYSLKLRKEQEETVIHAQGKHLLMRDGTRLAKVWYINEQMSGKDIDSKIETNISQRFEELLTERIFMDTEKFDHLTGLMNMGSFLSSAKESSDKLILGREVPTVLYFDMNDMKTFNQRYGIEEGNELLCIFADILKEVFEGAECARMGEDHFTVLTKADGIEEKLSIIFDRLKIANHGLTLPVRVGIYKDTFERVDLGTAIDRAKIACDVNKFTFESSYTYYDEEMRKASINREYVLRNFERALEEKWIRVYYQGIVRTESGMICNEEALARWIDPDKGVISPAKIVSVLEEVKLEYKLDLYMIDRILEDMAIRKRDNIPIVPVSVNLSRYDFECCDMVTEIDNRVNASGISHDMLIIEITETVIGLDPDFLKEQICRFHKAGFKVWMDDFGSGYSSLNILQDFEFDLIKLDMRFMKGFSYDNKNCIILRRIVQMATELGIDTLSEGVETEDQASFLREIGCIKQQGYLYAKPASMNEIRGYSRVDSGIYYEENYDTIVDCIKEKKKLDYVPDIWRDIPIPFAVFKVEYLDDGEVADTIHVYLNKEYSELMHKVTKSNVIGKGFLKVFGKVDKEWFRIADLVAKRRQNVHGRFFHDKQSSWMEYSLKSLPQKNYISITLTNIDHLVRENSTKAYTADDEIIRIADLLNRESNYRTAIERAINEMSQMIRADRIYIYTKEEDNIASGYEWCAEGVEHSFDLENIKEYAQIDQLKKRVRIDENIRMDNIEEIRRSCGELYELLKSRRIKRFIEVPLYDESRLIGYMGIDNYDEGDSSNTVTLLAGVSYFITARIVAAGVLQHMDHISSHDALTNVQNRYAMLKKTEELEKKQEHAGVIFVDINGLKKTNDTLGHDAGDQLIKNAANLLSAFFNEKNVYRTGGDEFVILVENVEEDEFEIIKRQLEVRINEPSAPKIAIGFCWCLDTRNLEKSMKIADKKMYEDKKKFYEKSGMEPR
ncbi:GGDEF domain-containing protein [Butyrivibrio sp. NC3005]|uniref:GGDEF domain-containing protein n=1 Tax=Butyrivibrio sp. NC3005 TaxID=1280685 RepID=UPI00040CEE2B|nr:EAL domain-containing protein [Butyrivibrio sp. NC3005]